MRQSAIDFKCKNLTLEGIISTPAEIGGFLPAIAVCHSHPMLGGDMNSPIVTSVCRAASGDGFATLRFNFRGVGESDGEFSNGKDEHNDVKAALNLLAHWPGVDSKRIGVVGYSAGASILLDGIRHIKRASAIVLIAPTKRASAIVLIAPTLAALRNRRFIKDKRPRLVIAGSEDRVAPSLQIQNILDECRGPVRFQELVGADHSMRGHESEIGRAVAEFLAQNL